MRKYKFELTQNQKKILKFLIENDWEIFVYKTDFHKGKLSFTKNENIVTFNYINTDVIEKGGHIIHSDTSLDCLRIIYDL